MTQGQLEKVDKMDTNSKSPCLVCGQQKASWDKHLDCFNCRQCNRINTCSICILWDTKQWKKIDRQSKAYARRNTNPDEQDDAEAHPSVDPGSDASQAYKRSAELSDLDAYSGEEGDGPSTAKSPKQDHGQ